MTQKTYTLKLTGQAVEAILLALPYVTDREVEEEIDLERRVGEFCDAVSEQVLDQFVQQGGLAGSG